MDNNPAYKEEPRTEILDGKTIMMSPRPSVTHNRVAFRIANIFYNFLKGKPCEAFADGTDVYLTKNDRVIPDVMIICNREIIKKNGIYGSPGLIVEVLSPGTAKKDRTYKKDLYENSGVKEYWIVEPEAQTVEVYLLSGNKYVLDDLYAVFPDDAEFTEEEKEKYKTKIPVSLYDNFTISLTEIFSDIF